MEELLIQFAGFTARVSEAAAIILVLYGSLEAFLKLAWSMVRPATHGTRKATWRRFGVWLLLALEFELAADIVKSVVSPTWEDIGELGAIAVIRTFLNYFLERDLESAERAAARSLEPRAPTGGLVAGAERAPPTTA